MAERQRRRPERVEESQLPISIVPIRTVVSPRQEQELRDGLERVQVQIRELLVYAEEMRVSPDARTSEGVRSDADRLRRTVERMNLTSVPILGERYANELEMINEVIGRAVTEADEGRLGNAVRSLAEAREKIVRIGEVYDIGMRMLLAGTPTNAQVSGVESQDLPDEVLQGLESALIDIGTRNNQRGLNILAVGRMLARLPQLSRIEGSQASVIRDRGYRFIIERGRDAREGVIYSQEDAIADQQFIEQFTEDLQTAQTLIRTETIEALTHCREQLELISADVAQDRIRAAAIQTLQQEIDSLLARLRRERTVDLQQARGLIQRYHVLSGVEQPRTEVEQVDDLRERAVELRGTSRRAPAEYSAAWYAQRALDALDSSEVQIARLSMMMGLLEQIANGQGRRYLDNYEEINRIIDGRIAFTPAMAQRFQDTLTIATLRADMDALETRYRNRGPAAKRQRIRAAIQAARLRLLNGDVAGAERLFDMVTTYTTIGEQRRWRAFAGAEQMEAALDAELTGADSSEQFHDGTLRHEFSSTARELRTRIGTWGRFSQKAVAIENLDHVDDLIEQGNLTRARRILTFIVMYSEAVERLGVRRGDRITSVDESDGIFLQGMERIMGYARQGRFTLADEPIEQRFVESYAAAQNAYVRREAGRIEALTAERELGQDQIRDALEAARQRASQGDFNGAHTILQYARDYYGGPERRQREGWRYALFSTRFGQRTEGYVQGRQEMLEAIEMEINAQTLEQHAAAAERFDSGSERIANTEVLLTRVQQLEERIMGRQDWVAGQSDTRGQLPLGARTGGRYEGYVALADIRRYERDFATADPRLRGQRTLRQLTRALRAAASTGNMVAFNRVIDRFNTRLGHVTAGAIRQQNLQSARDRLLEVNRMLVEIGNLYDNVPEGVPAPTARELSARRAAITRLEARRTALIHYISSLQATSTYVMPRLTGEALSYFESLQGSLNGAFPEEQLGEFLGEVSREARIARAFAVLNGQLALNEQYRQVVLSTHGEVATRTGARLVQCAEQLVAARRAVLINDFEASEQAYMLAISNRQEALMGYLAENSPMATQIFHAHAPGLAQVLGGRQAVRSAYDEQRRMQGFEFYRSAHMSSYHQILFGNVSDEELNRRGQIATLLETSIFATPQSGAAQITTDYARAQSEVLSQLRYAYENPGETATAALERAQSIMTVMQQTVQRNQQALQWALIGAGLAAAFIPVVGPYVSGAIFLGMAAEQIVTEYRVHGHASAESWAMAGLVVVSLGLMGAAARVGRAALAARAAGATTHAVRMTRIATGLNVANLGIATFFSGYAFYHGYQAYQRGDTTNAALMIGLGLFPWALMGGSAARRMIVARSARAQARIYSREFAREFGEAPPEVMGARELGNPSTMFRFMRLLRAQNPIALEIFGGFSARLRTQITQLMKQGNIRTALAAGEMNQLAEAALVRGIRTLDFPPPPRGPGGIRPLRDLASFISNPERFRAFLGELARFEATPAEARTSSMIAARARLDAIRAENPGAAQSIDTLLANRAVRHALETGIDTPFSNRAIMREFGTIDNPGPLRRPVPEELISEANAGEATMEFEIIRTGTGTEYVIEVPGQPRIMGETTMPPVRASATPPSGTPPGAGAPAGGASSRVGGERRTGGSGRAPREPGAREPAPPDAQQAELNAQALEAGVLRPGEQPRQVGRGALLYRRVVGRIRDWRARRAARRNAAEPPNTDAILEDAQARMGDIISDITMTPEQVNTVIGRANRVAETAEANVQTLRAGGAPAAEIQAAERAAILARAEATEVANMARNSVQRSIDLFIRIDGLATSGPRGSRAAYQGVLRKLYSSPNLRPHLEAAARSDPALARALARTQGSIRTAAGSSRTAEAYMELTDARPFTTEEVTLIIEATERSAAARLAEIESGLAASEARVQRTGQALETARANLEAARTRGLTGRRLRRVERAHEDANTAHETAFEQHQQLVQQSRDQVASLSPLAQTERLLGTEFSPGDRAALLLQLESRGAISGDVIIAEGLALRNSTRITIRGISAEGDPVAQAVRRGLSEQMLQGGNLDDAIATVLRSERVGRAVRENYGPRQQRIFEQAIGEGGNIEVVFDMGTPLARMLRSVRTPDMRANFHAIQLSNPRMEQLIPGISEQAGILAGEASLTVRGTVGEYATGAWRWMFGHRASGAPAHEPVVHWGGMQYYRAIQAARRAGGSVPYAMLRPSNSVRMVPQLATWAAMGYLGWRFIYNPLYDMLSNEDEIREGIALALRDFGVNISEENAIWITDTDEGRQFFFHLPNTLPQTTDRRPGNEQQLTALLEGNGHYLNPRRLNDFLDDGREMAGQLEEINELLETRRTAEEGSADRTEAERELLAIVRPWGISIEMIDATLVSEDKEQLDISDMADLRMDQWRERGIVMSFAEGVATQMLVDAGVITSSEVQAGRPNAEHAGMVRFLRENPDVFAFIWMRVQQGHIAVVHIDDVISDLSARGRMNSIREGLPQTRGALGRALQQRLTEQHLYLGTAIAQNSFLGHLDRRACTDPSVRSTLESLLRTYGSNTAALRAFNRFNLTEGDFGEEIYGDLNALATLIAENPRTALATARESGQVAPRVFAEMDGRLRESEYAEAIAFAITHSQIEGGRATNGVMKWMADNSHQIENLPAILRHIQANAQTQDMSAQAIYEYLDRQSAYYRTRGWWTGSTPVEMREAAGGAERRGRGDARSRPSRGRTPGTRAEILAEEERPRYPRRPGFETRQPAEQQEESEEEPAEVEREPTVGLSPEAQSFYQSEERGGIEIAEFIDARIDALFDDIQGEGRRRRGDGIVMRAAFGEDQEGVETADQPNRQRARTEIKDGIYRMIFGLNRRGQPAGDELRERQMANLRALGITVEGEGENIRVTFSIRGARAAYRNHIHGYARAHRSRRQ